MPHDMSLGVTQMARNDISFVHEQWIRREYMRVRTVTERALLAELRETYVGLLNTLSTYVLGNEVLEAYDLDGEASVENLPDLRRFEGVHNLLGFRRYAVDGQFGFEGEVEGYWQGTAHFTWQMIGIAYGGGDNPDPVLCLRVLHQGSARMKLDAGTDTGNFDTGDEPVLTLHEMALLAGMAERAVRNATLDSASDRLKTVADGSRVVVEAPEALRWLRGRRGFVETKRVQG